MDTNLVRVARAVQQRHNIPVHQKTGSVSALERVRVLLAEFRYLGHSQVTAYEFVKEAGIEVSYAWMCQWMNKHVGIGSGVGSKAEVIIQEAVDKGAFESKGFRPKAQEQAIVVPEPECVQATSRLQGADGGRAIDSIAVSHARNSEMDSHPHGIGEAAPLATESPTSVLQTPSLLSEEEVDDALRLERVRNLREAVKKFDSPFQRMYDLEQRAKAHVGDVVAPMEISCARNIETDSPSHGVGTAAPPVAESPTRVQQTPSVPADEEADDALREERVRKLEEAMKKFDSPFKRRYELENQAKAQVVAGAALTENTRVRNFETDARSDGVGAAAPPVTESPTRVQQTPPVPADEEADDALREERVRRLEEAKKYFDLPLARRDEIDRQRQQARNDASPLPEVSGPRGPARDASDSRPVDHAPSGAKHVTPDLSMSISEAEAREAERIRIRDERVRKGREMVARMRR